MGDLKIISYKLDEYDETFKDLDTASQASVPSEAAKIVIDNKTLSYDFQRIKEVDTNANTLPTSGAKNPDKKEREKVSKPKDNETSK